MRKKSYGFRLLVGAIACIGGLESAEAAFGLEDWGDGYTLDSGDGLTISVLKKNGDIKSIYFKDTELQAPGRLSHISSGLGRAEVTASVVKDQVIRVEMSTETLTHYLFMREGINVIYMATHITEEPRVGELRFIARLRSEPLPNSPEASDLRKTTHAVESKDVFGEPSGITRSKYYGTHRAKDLGVVGATGDGIGVFVDFGNRERSSGGPFFRDIENQHGANNEIYNYMNSGHNQTEPKRVGLHGPYAYIFTDGSVPPDNLDYRWMDTMKLGIKGYVGASGRREIICSAMSGLDPDFEYAVGISNANAQYWADASKADGSFSIQGVLPGTYDFKVYKGELAIQEGRVKVAGLGKVVIRPFAIKSDPSRLPCLWRIGDWDGTPNEFLNADKITHMHPSDSRIETWDPGTYVVGRSSPESGMPCYHWKEIGDGPQAIEFELSEEQVMESKLRIGITAAFSSGRPNVSVNAWKARLPVPSSQPKSRSLTIGTYRGNNHCFEYAIPASALVVGTNTLRFSPNSGSGMGGFLSASFSLDCIDFSNASVESSDHGATGR